MTWTRCCSNYHLHTTGIGNTWERHDAPQTGFTPRICIWPQIHPELEWIDEVMMQSKHSLTVWLVRDCSSSQLNFCSCQMASLWTCINFNLHHLHPINPSVPKIICHSSWYIFCRTCRSWCALWSKGQALLGKATVVGCWALEMKRWAWHQHELMDDWRIQIENASFFLGTATFLFYDS